MRKRGAEEEPGGDGLKGGRWQSRGKEKGGGQGGKEKVRGPWLQPNKMHKQGCMS